MKPEKNIAIIIAHGMGQQVRFETLSALAEIIQSDTEIQPESIKTKILNYDSTLKNDIPVIEMNGIKFKGSDEKSNLNIYEVYWAPFTEGMIKAYEITLFLFINAFRFLPTLFTTPVFKRFIFGKLQEFRISNFGTFFSISGFLIFLSGIILLYLTVGFVFLERASKFLFNLSNKNPELITSFQNDIIAFYSPLIITAILIFVIAKGFKIYLRISKALPRNRSVYALLKTFLISAIILFMLLTDFKILVDLTGTKCTLIDNFQNIIMQFQPFFYNRITITIFFIFVFIIIYSIREAYIQFLGDVVIYVSSHTLNRFDEIRTKIKAAGASVFNYVYGLKRGEKLYYDKIIIIGHSLGSVIAYDCLNSEIKNDVNNLNESASRTHALITFGSPLNKTAYLFRKQLNKLSIFREELALEKQPLVKNYKFRPEKWINIYSRADIISGKLKFYDTPCPESEKVCLNQNPKRVRNIPDPQARTLFLAHTEYWKNDLLKNTIADQIKEAFANSNDIPNS